MAPGVYRSNQPTHRRFEKYAGMGIKTVINLRGKDDSAQYLYEKESCEQLGLTLVNTRLMSRKAAPRASIEAALTAIRQAERPLMFHCKSGADRSGFIAAAYLLTFENADVDTAMEQLALKYLHLEFTKTGIQDYVLRVFKARHQLSPIGFEDWIRIEYSANLLQEGWDNRRPEAEMVRALLVRAMENARNTSQVYAPELAKSAGFTP
ncbi:MAG: dual specificity protein phosphatase family protein [Pelagimonas sp.]|nr:dual specificity protein phosphatase family protein [Pelagimonas sp.]